MALTIPSYKSPKLSVPSGTVGIIAGNVPSVFSAYATRESNDGSFKRQIYPNMMTELYDIPTIPRVEFPDVVWRWLNSSTSDDKRTRRQIMIDHWRDDRNMHVFSDGINHQKFLLLTGNENYRTDMKLTSDKLIMMGQLKAVTLQMSRPLLEICMAARGKKTLPGSHSCQRIHRKAQLIDTPDAGLQSAESGVIWKQIKFEVTNVENVPENEMENKNEWNQLAQKLDTALEHNTTELQQIADIYKRLGMTEQANEIETLMASRKKIVPMRICRAFKQNRQAS